jgi:hypothetical protein
MIRTDAEDGSESWSSYQKLVLGKLQDLKEINLDVEKRLRSVEHELGTLRLKSSFWGAVSGVSAYGLTMLVQYFTRKP